MKATYQCSDRLTNEEASLLLESDDQKFVEGLLQTHVQPQDTKHFTKRVSQIKGELYIRACQILQNKGREYLGRGKFV